MAGLEMIKSQKGKDLLIHEGFTFIFDKNGANNKKIWRCSKWTQKKTNSCLARCHTSNESVIWHSENHSHIPDPILIDAKKIMQNIKNQARTTTDNTKSIISSNSISNIKLPIQMKIFYSLTQNSQFCPTV